MNFQICCCNHFFLTLHINIENITNKLKSFNSTIHRLRMFFQYNLIRLVLFNYASLVEVDTRIFLDNE